jgi:hypothetical protein
LSNRFKQCLTAIEKFSEQHTPHQSTDNKLKMNNSGSGDISLETLIIDLTVVSD